MTGLIERERQEIARANKIVEMPDRGHSLTIDHGWRGVAEKALEFVKRHG